MVEATSVRSATVFPPAQELAAHLRAARQARLLLSRLDHWLLDEVRADIGERVLDMGCGHGNLMSLLRDRELIVGTDIDPESVEYVCQRFRGQPRIRAHVFDATRTPPQRLLDYELDTVLSLNVLEHIERDAAAIENMAKLLTRKGGTLIVIVPAHMRLYGALDVALGHYRRYSKSRLRSLLKPVGARIKRQLYMNLLGALGWWWAGRVLRRRTLADGQLSLFDRLVPLLAGLERRARPPFGLSLVTVAVL